MSSLSSFDDLLSELDTSPAGPSEKEDPLRSDCLKRLVDLSKQLEKIAIVLDPSEKKHPLHGLTVPTEARAKLKNLVNELMVVQGELQKAEEALLEPAPQDGSQMLHAEETPRTESSTVEPITEVRHLPEILADAITKPSIDSITPPEIDLNQKAELERERAEFAAYKSQWETFFAADPLKRDAHPEVAAYYKQMEAYFAEKESLLTHSAKKGTE